MEIIEKDNQKEYASKAVGNTALGLSIGALGIELLRGGLGGGLFGLSGVGATAGQVAYDYD